MAELLTTTEAELLAALKSADESFAQLHKINRLPAGENNAGWRDVRAAIAHVTATPAAEVA